MLSSILRSRQAVEVNIAIMRTFVRLRRILADNALLRQKIEAMEQKYDEQFQQVFAVLRQMLADDAQPQPPIGYHAEAKDDKKVPKKSGKANGIDDGRCYFVCRDGKRITGLVGLHHYNWGPSQNVWLAWFAVHPDCQRKGLGGILIDHVEQLAIEMGYSRLFVETYEHDDFEKAQGFYAAKGFTRSGRIDNYLPDGSAMIVYRKDLPE